MTMLPLDKLSSGESGEVAALTLEQPGRGVVVLDSDLLERLDRTLEHVERAFVGSVTGLVVRSASRVFVAGASLRELSDLDDKAASDYLRTGSAVFERLAHLPLTTVAAINGAALGGGLELALHCDHLVAMSPQPGPDGTVKGYPIGLPEASLGLCPGWGGTNLLLARVAEDWLGEAIRGMCSGAPMSVESAAESGLVESLAETPKGLEALAVDLAGRSSDGRRGPRHFAGDASRREAVRAAMECVRGELEDTEASRAIVGCIEAGLTHGYPSALELERASLIGLRHTETARERLASFFAKSERKPSETTA